jgi:hypothetical protein
VAQIVFTYVQDGRTAGHSRHKHPLLVRFQEIIRASFRVRKTKRPKAAASSIFAQNKSE